MSTSMVACAVWSRDAVRIGDGRRQAGETGGVDELLSRFDRVGQPRAVGDDDGRITGKEDARQDRDVRRPGRCRR